MDSITEKKWFVYVGDHHEGPFSLETIQEKVSSGVVTTENFVWAEGMSDWKPMLEVPEFAQLLAPAGVSLSSAEDPILVETSATATSPFDLGSRLAVETPLVLEENFGANALTLEDPVVEQVDHNNTLEMAIKNAAGAVSIEGVETQSSSFELSSPVQDQSENSSPQITLTSKPAHSIADEKTGDLDVADLQKAKSIGAKAVTAQSAQSVEPEKKKSGPSPLLIKLFVLVLLFGGGTFVFQQGYLDSVLQNGMFQDKLKNLSKQSKPYLLQTMDKFPALGAWISPIPALSDVSPDEYEALKSAAIEIPGPAGPKIALALSKADPLNPSFYVASHLPDGVQFRIYMVGVADTLLNQLSFGTQIDINLNQRFGASTPIRMPDGKPIPKGEYMIYLTPSPNQSQEIQTLLASAPSAPQKPAGELSQDTKVLVFKTYFLGGTRDATYTARLKEFHDKLRLKASEELKEVSQFLNTMESQFNSTAAKFALLKKGKPLPKQKQAWEAFHNEWVKLQGQLDQILQKWTPESIHNDYFYENLYLLTQQVGQAVVKVHGFHHSFFSGVGDQSTFEIQVGEATSSAQTAISQLKAKVDQAAALPPSPNGMPIREGI